MSVHNSKRDDRTEYSRAVGLPYYVANGCSVIKEISSGVSGHERSP